MRGGAGSSRVSNIAPLKPEQQREFGKKSEVWVFVGEHHPNQADVER